jgi:hypothetical protein
MHVDDPASITTLALMPFGAVTHSFDMSARRLELPFTVQADGSLTVDLPGNSNLLTPGYWMLFAINNNDVPSIASTVHVKTPLLYDLPAQLPLVTDPPIVATSGPNRAPRTSPHASDVRRRRRRTGTEASCRRARRPHRRSTSFDINVGNNDNGADGMGSSPQRPRHPAPRGGGVMRPTIRNGIEVDTPKPTTSSMQRPHPSSIQPASRPVARRSATSRMAVASGATWSTAKPFTVRWRADVEP